MSIFCHVCIQRDKNSHCGTETSFFPTDSCNETDTAAAALEGILHAVSLPQLLTYVPFPCVVVYLALRNGRVRPAVLLELYADLGDGGGIRE